MGMSKGKVIGIVVGVIVVIAVLAFVLWLVGTYNSLVNENEQVDAQWAEVTNQYQRKIDLIPALVSTLGNYSEFEQATLTNITALRSRWMNSSGEDQVNATNELDRQLVAIQVTFEAYPDLKTIEAVNNVMYELAGTENRITVAAATTRPSRTSTRTSSGSPRPGSRAGATSRNAATTSARTRPPRRRCDVMDGGVPL
jgi:LemA protein